MHLFRVEKKDRPSLLIILGVLSLSGIISYRYVSMQPRLESKQVQLLMMGIALLFMGILALWDMRLGLSLMVLSSVPLGLSIGTGTASSITLAFLWVFMLLAIWVVRMLIIERQIRLLPSPINLPWIAFLAALLLSWAASSTITRFNVRLPPNILTVQAAQVALFVLSAAAFWLFANHPVPDKTLKIWTWAIIGFGFLSFAYEALLRKDFYAQGMNGALLMWPVALLVSQLLFNPQLSRWLRLAGLGLLALWLLWIFRWSFEFKGGWMPAALAIALLIFLKNHRLGITLGLLGGGYLLWSNFGQAFFAGEEASLFRPYIWLDVIRMGLRSPLLGLGPAVYMFHWADPSFQSLTFQVSRTYAWNRFNFSPPSHNLFVDVFAQAGIVGAILFFWLLAAIVIFGWRVVNAYQPGFQRAYASGVIAGFIAITVSSAPFADWLIPFVYNIGLAGFTHSVYSWLLLGSLVALDYRLRECPQNE